MTVTRDMEMAGADAALLQAFASLFTQEEPELQEAHTTFVPQFFFCEDLDVRVIVQAVLANDDAAVVRIEAGYLDEDDGLLHTWQVEGSAKRDPVDKPNRETGIALATARAFQNLANQFHRQAEGRVEHADKMFIQRAEQMVSNADWKAKQRKAGELKAKQRKIRKEEMEMIETNVNGQGSKTAKKIKKKVNAK